MPRKRRAKSSGKSKKVPFTDALAAPDAMQRFATISVSAAGGYDVMGVKSRRGQGARGANLPGGGKKLAGRGAKEDDLVVVDVEFAGINYADVCVRWGLYSSAKEFVGFPITPGFEFAGRVAEIPSLAAGRDGPLKVGDRVVGVTMFGGYSTRIVVPCQQLLRIPEGVKSSVAAGLPAVSLTAHYALHHLVGDGVGSKSKPILVHSAAGGVGSMISRLAKAKGCSVVGVVGAPHKVEPLEKLDCCDFIIDKSSSDLWQEARRFSPGGYAAIFDANGKATLQNSYDHLAPEGRLVVYGFHTMLPRKGGRITPCHWMRMAWDYLWTPRFNPLSMVPANKSVMAFNLSFLFDRIEYFRPALEDILRQVADNSLRGTSDNLTIFPMSQAAEAHALIESGQSVGKIVLQVDEGMHI